MGNEKTREQKSRKVESGKEEKSFSKEPKENEKISLECGARDISSSIRVEVDSPFAMKRIEMKLRAHVVEIVTSFERGLPLEERALGAIQETVESVYRIHTSFEILIHSWLCKYLTTLHELLLRVEKSQPSVGVLKEGIRIGDCFPCGTDSKPLKV